VKRRVHFCHQSLLALPLLQTLTLLSIRFSSYQASAALKEQCEATRAFLLECRDGDAALRRDILHLEGSVDTLGVTSSEETSALAVSFSSLRTRQNVLGT
jgi:hypothetical protein